MLIHQVRNFGLGFIVKLDSFVISTLSHNSCHIFSDFVQPIWNINETSFFINRVVVTNERSDLSSAMASLISPCALNNDAVYLQLLVKLGRTQQAAEAFSARRSLLLLETLHERPISGAGTVDLVIYAAQLSQSFFSCLATAVEKFLDLFLMSQTGGANGDKQEDSFSLGESSLHSNSDLPKGISSGAVASVVLWCDSELAKFASAFGGTRVLANLALSPPPRDAPKKPRVVGQEADVNGSKERKNAMEVAAQCVDQAFLYASQNLDSVGLPLTPRLAEYIRARLVSTAMVSTFVSSYSFFETTTTTSKFFVSC